MGELYRNQNIILRLSYLSRLCGFLLRECLGQFWIWCWVFTVRFLGIHKIEWNILNPHYLLQEFPIFLKESFSRPNGLITNPPHSPFFLSLSPSPGPIMDSGSGFHTSLWGHVWQDMASSRYLHKHQAQQEGNNNNNNNNNNKLTDITCLYIFQILRLGCFFNLKFGSGSRLTRRIFT